MGGSSSKALGEDLRSAANAGDTAQVQTLLAAKAKVDHTDKHGGTALMKASIEGHISPMETLLAAKANVNQANKHGCTSLVMASGEGQSAPMELLVAAKANVDHTEKHGRTSLMLASGNSEMVEFLLAVKANVDHTDNSGNSALMYASISIEGHIAPVETLLAAKANVNQANEYGHTARIWASTSGHSELAELLESWSQLTPLMRAVVTQSPQEIKALLHEGADPTCAVQLPSGIRTAHSLAINDPPRTWFSTTCSDTVDLIESSLTWSVESHNLFSPGFRRGVKHVCGLKVALDRADHQLSNSVWMMIIAYLPRKSAV